jgi:hypothetical protein
MRNSRQIHFRASARECDALNAIAEEEGTTVSAILRRLIRTYPGHRASQRNPLTLAASPADATGRDTAKAR